MVKVKRVRTIDAVVVGYRPGKELGTVGSLILGLYDDDGDMHVVGHSSGLRVSEKDDSCPNQDSRTPKRSLSGPGSLLPAASATAAELSPAAVSHRSFAAISLMAAPTLSATAAPASYAAARIPSRSLPANTAHNSASPVLLAAPSLHSTALPSADAALSGAPSAPGAHRPGRSLPHRHLRVQLVEACQIYWRHRHHCHRCDRVQPRQQFPD